MNLKRSIYRGSHPAGPTRGQDVIVFAHGLADGVVQRFWAKVDRRGPDECWLWTAGTRGNGYGAMTVNRRVCGAHRLAYQLAHGSIPNGLYVLHRCDEPRCVNPAHLYAGTQVQNGRDASERGRMRFGEDARTAKLTATAVREIRRRRSDGEPLSVLAADFGVTEGTVCVAARGRTWKHVKC